jgi:peptide chain release factor 1
MEEIKEIKKEYDEILEQLSNPELISDWERFEELSKKKKRLGEIIEKEKQLEEIKNQIEENKAILGAREDSELISLAEAELKSLVEKERVLEKELDYLLKEKEGEPSSAIIEIRAGVGGQEAALFAKDLFQMYSKYGQSQGWGQKILESHPTELGGFKEIIFELTPQRGPGGGGDVFSKLKYEGGVHRVQRIPETEKSGRIHTSTATVAVLPKPKKTEIKINPKDLKIDFYRASGPGGQYVNKKETAVRITHLPTGIVVTSQAERNQLQNKENAMAILGAKVLERERLREEEKISGKRKAQIGWARRSEKIRTYNFPQDRITDHRIKKTWHNLEEILEGKLDSIIKTLEKSQSQS